MTPLNIAVLGGTGFVGRLLVKRLALAGHRVRVLSRNLGARSERLLPPEVMLRQLDAHDPASLDRALQGVDAVINLVGILNEAGDDGRGFQRAHVDLVQASISACQRLDIRRLLQMSSLNAGRGASHYLRSRGDAEALVKASGLDWTIFEPAVIYGEGDGLFTRFAALLRQTPVLPIARAGCRFAPVYVGDVVEAMLRALDDPRSFGEIYELYGPDVFTLRELVVMTARQLRLQRLVVPLPDVLGRIQAFACDFIPGKPFSSDNYRSLQVDSVGGIDGLNRLGIAPRRVVELLPEILGHQDDRQTRLARYRAMH